MVLNWQRVQGTQSDRPLETDTTSSPSCVYLRKNIAAVKIQSGEDQIDGWEYDETVLTPEEYEQYREIKEIVDAAQDDDTKRILDALLGGAA